ncbi:class I SAM-dependent methyltransferase [Rhodococcus chondri]|uniref:Class I SAM-dependent methyltransferase n=1 Tax=Rhodococcus chondri TaxID=3065941 RepID=A0ABU7JQH3_9NOCA|nr:class I SAM-dependent methyltransferase [Rhodococcus sp. CC-R104]MEE2031587.1 class I SAM-dependent methyltransferase [Rhodococcus sp. CC-R104]
MSDVTPAEFWEARYTDSGGLWSGNANPTFVAAVSDLPPGTALDLGCGEGGDTIWLADRGWTATGIDISPTAVRRAAETARSAGIPDDRVRFVAADLATWESDDSYDLVAASFLHSPVDFPRTEVLRRAAELVAPGGHLLILSHADFPPWAGAGDRNAEEHGEAHHEHRFLTPAEEIEALALDPGRWDVLVAETRERDATGPDGTHAVLSDVVVLLHRN